MKKVLFTLFVAVIVLAACSKKDSNPSNSAKIIGEWDLQTQVSAVKENEETIRDTTYYLSGSTIRFTKDGKSYSSVRSADSNKLIKDTSNYEIDGDILTMRFSDDTTVAKIEKLTKSDLTLIQSDNDGSKFTTKLTK